MKFNFNRISKKTRPFTIWSVVYLTYFTVGLNNKEYNLIAPLLLTLLQLITYTINKHLFIPKFYEIQKQKFIIYNIIFIPFLVIFLTNIAAYIIKPRSEIDPPPNDIFIYLFQIVLCLIALWIAINQYLVEKEKRNEKEIETLKRVNLENNLQLLKSQINPHFLFNALNNIYTMSYMGDKTTPQKIDKLSDMLRFILYDCESEFIPVYKELEYINNFIDFQQLKTESKQNIEFSYQFENTSLLIAPMIFIPFIENAFKHSKIERHPEHQIKITLKQVKGNLSFSITNHTTKNDNSFHNNKPQNGIGLKNVINRLKLIYPDSHKLDICNNNNLFIVNLNINLNESQREEQLHNN